MTKILQRATLALSLAATVAACGQKDAPEAPADAAPAAEVDAAAQARSAPLQRLDVDPATIPAGGNCSLDTINGQPIAAAAVRAGDEVVVIGWLGDPQGQVPSHSRLLLVGNGVIYGADLRIDVDRPDVAEALGQVGLAKSGFRVLTTLPSEPGHYRISALIGEPATAHCQFDVEISIAAPLA